LRFSLTTLIEGGWWGESWLNTPYCCTNWVRFTSCAFLINCQEITSFVARLQNCRRPPPYRYYLCSSNQHLFPTHFKFCCDRKRAIAGDSAAYRKGSRRWAASIRPLFPDLQVRHATKFFKNSLIYNVAVRTCLREAFLDRELCILTAPKL
jgi:hypothetical protein